MGWGWKGKEECIEQEGGADSGSQRADYDRVRVK